MFVLMMLLLTASDGDVVHSKAVFDFCRSSEYHLKIDEWLCRITFGQQCLVSLFLSVCLSLSLSSLSQSLSVCLLLCSSSHGVKGWIGIHNHKQVIFELTDSWVFCYRLVMYNGHWRTLLLLTAFVRRYSLFSSRVAALLSHTNEWLSPFHSAFLYIYISYIVLLLFVCFNIHRSGVLTALFSCGMAGETVCMCYSAITGSAPSYLSELHLYSPSRSLRSSSDTQKYG